jgi:hypothetical protein
MRPVRYEPQWDLRPSWTGLPGPEPGRRRRGSTATGRAKTPATVVPGSVTLRLRRAARAYERVVMLPCTLPAFS